MRSNRYGRQPCSYFYVLIHTWWHESVDQLPHTVETITSLRRLFRNGWRVAPLQAFVFFLVSNFRPLYSLLVIILPATNQSDVFPAQRFESQAVLQAPHITFSTSWITQTGVSYDRRSPVPNWPQPFQPHDQPDLSPTDRSTKKSDALLSIEQARLS